VSTIRSSRTRLLTAAATVAMAALSLTACNDGTGVHDEGASAGTSAASASASMSSGSGPSSHEDAKSAPAGSKHGADVPAAKKEGKGVAGSGTGGSGTRGTRAVTCQGSNTKTVAAPLNRPVNHMLLTVTNTGSASCYLYGYPAVRFSHAQSVPPVIEASHPQAVVTLAPGESGYASVNLSAADGSGTNGRTETSLTIYFQGRTAGEDVPSAARPSLPAKGIYIDDSLKVTYWQQSMDDAISW
jgi:predicted small secreted protein